MRAYKITPVVRQADVKQVRAITRQEFIALRGKSDSRMTALLDMMWWTGARISEVLGDEITGIPALTVADGLRLVREGYITTRGKSGKIRVLVLPSAGRGALRSHVEAEALQSSATRPLFPMTPQGVNSALHRLGFAGGMHAFRHAYRARLRQAGISEDLARSLLGHGPQNTTAGYGTPQPDELLRAVEVLRD